MEKGDSSLNTHVVTAWDLALSLNFLLFKHDLPAERTSVIPHVGPPINTLLTEPVVTVSGHVNNIRSTDRTISHDPTYNYLHARISQFQSSLVGLRTTSTAKPLASKALSGYPSGEVSKRKIALAR